MQVRSMNTPVGYTAHDLTMYFQGHPLYWQERLWYIERSESHDEVRLATLPGMGTREVCVVPVKDLTWDAFKLPPLGYKSTGEGKFIWWCELLSHAGTAKGVCDRRMKYTMVWPVDAYVNAWSHNEREQPPHHIIYREYDENYPDAVTFLESTAGRRCVGRVLSSDVAIVRGIRSKYLLHCKGDVLGYTLDGLQWVFPAGSEKVVEAICKRINLQGVKSYE